MSTRSNDPKVDVGSRYKILLRWYSHLAARAAMSEKTFDIATGDGEKILSKVETTLKQLSIEESLNTCGKTFSIDASKKDEDIEKNVQGIKCKPKRKGDGSSIRLKSALEKATKKRNRRIVKSVKTVREEKQSQVHDDHLNLNVLNSCGQLTSQRTQQQWDSTLDMNTMNQSTITSMVDLLQAQIPQPRFLQGGNLEENQKNIWNT
ncbi:hypothetical protein V6N11_066250 [Hibiscus sabdariffa]|uniref:Uncharacterized protein n=1 Tax=Hibiscus sabdariffa TaxID=183260 RepID=A0ABR1ZZ51_9ROSI